MYTIGYVEDNHAIRENYAEYLTEAGFVVVAFDNAQDALSCFQDKMPDVLLLDIGLGRQRDAGLQLCLDIRRFHKAVPIVFLTSHDTDFERISGLRMGADDYITKDTDIEYILVRIETLIRRNQAIQEVAANRRLNTRTDADLSIDDQRCRVTWKGKGVALSLTQFWILTALVRAQGVMKTHDDLMKAANIVVEPNTIAAHIKSIRNSFKMHNPDFNNIKTLRGIGYQWIAS
jgi:two-component system OmpR family response regulator